MGIQKHEDAVVFWRRLPCRVRGIKAPPVRSIREDEHQAVVQIEDLKQFSELYVVPL